VHALTFSGGRFATWRQARGGAIPSNWCGGLCLTDEQPVYQSRRPIEKGGNTATDWCRVPAITCRVARSVPEVPIIEAQGGCGAFRPPGGATITSLIRCSPYRFEELVRSVRFRTDLGRFPLVFNHPGSCGDCRQPRAHGHSNRPSTAVCLHSCSSSCPAGHQVHPPTVDGAKRLKGRSQPFWVGLPRR